MKANSLWPPATGLVFGPRIPSQDRQTPANMKGAMATDTEFWVEHGENLEQRFNAWAAR